MGGYAVSVAQRSIRYQYTNPDIPSGNTVASTLLANPEVDFTSNTAIPASVFMPNTIVRIYAAGLFGSGILSLPLTVKIKSGSSVLGSFSFTPALNLVNKGWEMDLTCNVFDLSSVEIQGDALFNTVMGSVGNTSTFSVNMNNDVPISVSAQWGALALGGTIQLRMLTVQVS